MITDELLYTTADGAAYPLPLNAYPDTTPLVPHVTMPPTRVLLRPRSFASFVAAMFWLDALAWRHNCRPHLILPFIPGARQDRLNDSGDSLFTAKSVAAMINARGLPSVTVLDPHSEVSAGMVDRCRVVHAADCINVPAGKYAAVIASDAGAEKRAGAAAHKLGVPLIHAWKSRDVATGNISGFGFDAAGLFAAVADEQQRILLVDDICDGGGTFVGLAAAIKKAFPALDLHLFTTHGIYSKGLAQLQPHFSHIYCTDSILPPTPGVITIPVCERLLHVGAL